MQAREYPRGHAWACMARDASLRDAPHHEGLCFVCAASSLNALAFHSGFSQLFTSPIDYFLRILTFILLGIFCPGPVPIRSALRWSSRRGTGRGGPQTLPDRPRQRERTARVHVRATVRTNGGRGHQLQTLGHPAGRQIHPCAERRRKAASEAPVRVTRSSLASAEPLPVCRCLFQRCAGCPPG